MRVKISTYPPLTKLDCWFAVSEKLEKQTIHHLKKKLVDSLQLKREAVQIKLSIDDFTLLPQSKIKDLVRDGDLLTIKPDSAPITLDKKRKLGDNEKEKEEKKRIKKKKDDTGKKAKTSSTKGKNSSEDDKKQKDGKKEKKKKSSDRKKTEREERKEKKKAAMEEKKEKKKATVEEKKIPFEGTKATKSRNLRRKLLKKRFRKQQDEKSGDVQIVEKQAAHETSAANLSQYDTTQLSSSIQIEQPQAETSNQENEGTLSQAQAELLQPALNVPEKLLKKNKNKKKNHLKGAKAENRTHQHFDTAEPEETSYTRSNAYGRAFVTTAETETNPRTTFYGSYYSYPIHNVPTLFYAERPIHDEEQEAPVQENESHDPVLTEEIQNDGDAHIEDIEHAANVNAVLDNPNTSESHDKENTQEAFTPAVVDYEKYPDANFVDNVPKVGNELALKTLELTASYTPEISEWKQAKLLQLNLPESIEIEYKPGFGKASTKGGKFDNRKYQKRAYNDWYDDQEEEEENEEEEERIVTIATSDIFAVKNMSL